jgi:hypothetical protein
MSSAFKFMSSSWSNGTITAQTPNVNPPQQTIGIWLSDIRPHALLQWRSECSTTLLQWGLVYSPTPKGNFLVNEKIPGDNIIHKDCFVNIIW